MTAFIRNVFVFKIKRVGVTAVPHNCYQDVFNTVITVISCLLTANGHEITEQE